MTRATGRVRFDVANVVRAVGASISNMTLDTSACGAFRTYPKSRGCHVTLHWSPHGDVNDDVFNRDFMRVTPLANVGWCMLIGWCHENCA